MHFSHTDIQKEKSLSNLDQAFSKSQYLLQRRNTEEEFLFGTRMVRMDSVCLEAEDNVGSDQQRPPFAQFVPPGFLDYGSKKYSKFGLLFNVSLDNLRAIDCYVTIEGPNPYEKTYQDRLDVSHLVDDVFTANKSLNLDKIFVEQQDTSC